MFDPDLTNTGHQPQEYDQLTTVYGQYCVVGAVLKSELQNENDTAVDGVLVYSDANVSSLNVQTLGEARWAKPVSFGVSTGQVIINHNLPPVAISTIQGQKALESDPNNYQGTGVNPVDTVFGIAKYESTDQTSSMGIWVNFSLEFQCIFKEKTDNSASLLRMRKSKLAYIEYLEKKEVPLQDLSNKIKRLSALKSELA